MNRWTFAVVLAVAATTFACPWDYETYAAEWKALPCLAPVAANLDRLAALETSKTEPSAELLESLRAVVAMLAVYGAGQVSHLWLALGDLALEARLPRTAWASWERARTLGHPRAKELEVFQRRLEGSLRTGWKPSAPIAELMKSHHLDPSEGGWAGMNRSDARERERYTAKWAEYERIERKLVKGGLSFWNAQGAQALFAEQVKLGLRCEVRDEALPQEVTEATEPVPFIRDLDPTMKCAELARALDGALSREQEAIEERARTVLRSRSGLEGIAAVGARCGPALKGVAERARAITATP